MSKGNKRFWIEAEISDCRKTATFYDRSPQLFDGSAEQHVRKKTEENLRKTPPFSFGKEKQGKKEKKNAQQQ